MKSAHTINQPADVGPVETLSDFENPNRLAQKFISSHNAANETNISKTEKKKRKKPSSKSKSPEKSSKSAAKMSHQQYEKAYGVQITESKNSKFSNRKYSVELSSSIQLKDLSGKPKKTFHAGSLMLKSVESLRQNATMTSRMDNEI